jgi:DNA topoisomerase-1
VTIDANLRFGSDREPGIRRHGTKRFTYVDDRTGRPPSRPRLAQIAALAVPPAWTDVWIARDDASHLQATGRDARGRKQYRYHPDFTASRAENKFADLAAFGMALGGLRRRVQRDLAAGDLGHDQVVAAIVRLLDLTSLRVGNAEYARTNRSYGLTTLRTKHARVRGSSINLVFRGKSAHEFDVAVENPRVARIVRRCQHLPGQALFEYRTETGEVRPVGSDDVNRYLADHARPGVTAKTFRTWNATVMAASGLASTAEQEEAPTARALNEVIERVAAELGNTRTVCRQSYVHPTVVEAYLDSSLLSRWNRPVSTTPSGLTVDERRTLRLVRHPRPRS